MGNCCCCCNSDAETCLSRPRRSPGGICCFECTEGLGDQKRGKGCFHCVMPETYDSHICIPFKPGLWCCVETWGKPSNWTRRTLACTCLMPWAVVVGALFILEFIAYVGLLSGITVVTVVVAIVLAIAAAIIFAILFVLLLLFGACICMVLVAMAIDE